VDSSKSDVGVMVDELGVLTTPGEEIQAEMGLGSVVVKNDVRVTTREVRMGRGEVVDSHMVELRVNDVCVEVIEHSHSHSSHGHSSVATATTTSAATVKQEKTDDSSRSRSVEIKRAEVPVEMKKRSSSLKRGKGTIKKMWKKVVGSVKG